jgi:hypothetical protein
MTIGSTQHTEAKPQVVSTDMKDAPCDFRRLGTLPHDSEATMGIDR